MSALSSDPIESIGRLFPEAREKGGATGAPAHGFPVFASVPLGAPLLVDGTTYKHAIFIAPCDGCFIKEAWLSAAVKIGSGTNTIAFDNYDASGDAARNVLSTATIDPDTITTTEGLQLTLSTTLTDRVMDEGDVLNAVLVCGTMTTAGQGYVVT